MNKLFFSTSSQLIQILLLLLITPAVSSSKGAAIVIFGVSVINSEQASVWGTAVVSKNKIAYIGETECDGKRLNEKYEKKVYRSGEPLTAYIGGRAVGPLTPTESWRKDVNVLATTERFDLKQLTPRLASNRSDLGHDFDGRMELTQPEKNSIELLQKRLLLKKDLSEPQIHGNLITKRRISDKEGLRFISLVTATDRSTHKSVEIFFIARDINGALEVEYEEDSKRSMNIIDFERLDQLDIDGDGIDELFIAGKIYQNKDDGWKVVLETPTYTCT